MDRFVTRTPTWKTLNYTSVAAKSLAQKNSKFTKESLVHRKENGQKNPLLSKQLSEITQTFGDDLLRSNQANAENINCNSNDSGLSSASSISPQHLKDNDGDGGGSNQVTKKINRKPTKTHLGKLADYVDCPADKENDTCMTITHESAVSQQKKMESGINFRKIAEVLKSLPAKETPPPPATGAQAPTPENPLQNHNKMLLSRIQRDLNSPSAAARLKAIKALKSPTKSAYSHFDVPEAEQSLNIPAPTSLQEIMRNIVVYVEVRSGEDNRSAGVRKVIEALGARVNLSLLRDTTHVVFKDGLLSTFKKAIQMGIPVVSILWIEACKNERRICDPKDYPISNLDRYENPEFYDKMKRIKSMQPDSECNKRIRAKVGGGTPKDSTPTQKTGALKKTSLVIGVNTPTSSINKKKTDISQYFKRLEKSTPNAISKIGGGDSSHHNTVTESPASQLLNRINSECYTPLLKEVRTDHSNNKQSNEDNNPKELSQAENANGFNSMCRIKKALDFIQANTAESVIDEKVDESTKESISLDEDQNVNRRNRRRSSSSTRNQQQILETKLGVQVSKSPIKKGKPRRRHSSVPVSEIETATVSMNSMAISITPNRATRRRSSLHTTKDLTTAENSKLVSNIETITEEETNTAKEIATKTEKCSKSISRRKTLFDIAVINQTDLVDLKANKEREKSIEKSTRRRTIYATKTMETSEIKIDTQNSNTSKITTRRRTCYSVRSIEQVTEIIDEAKTPVTKEILNTGKKNMMPDKSNNRRRTLFVAATDKNVNSAVDCTTPTSFCTGEIASSTLLDCVSKPNLFATPPPATAAAADVTNGKLVEETEECVTPLIFSSTRLPSNKRRTLFDASMDIITQRLQSINQSARRSLLPPTPSFEVESSAVNAQAIDTPVNTKDSRSTETLVECYQDIDEHNAADVDFTVKRNDVKKKRKLFIPNELNTPQPLLAATVVSLNSGARKLPTETTDPLLTPRNKTSSTVKRRRTLMPISQPQLTMVEALKSKASDPAKSTLGVSKRRSTLDFEQIQNIKTKNANGLNNKNANASAPPPSADTEPSNLQTVAKAKKVLVYTNMHHQQIDVIREAINKLGLFHLESSVNDSTTHLVSLEPRRTLNLLRALTRGLWILEYKWISDSLNAGKWLSEETYELQNFSRAVEVCRSERQAFGAKYKCELFREFGTFYISSQCYPIKKENMRELILLCGGRVVNNRQKARYIIGVSKQNLENKIYLTPYWVLDSITQMQLMKINKYIYPLPSTAATTLSLPTDEGHQ